jgi:hypothetical protein
LRARVRHNRHTELLRACRNAQAQARRGPRVQQAHPLAFLSLLVALPLARAATPPNIVIFLVDDMGVMDTSVPFLTDAAGQPKEYPLNEHYRTPNMERLAARAPVARVKASPLERAARRRRFLPASRTSTT